VEVIFLQNLLSLFYSFTLLLSFAMPAKKKIKSRQVNLIPQEGLTSTTSGKIILWVLSTFRIILIITEIFVIGAFISRFWLDAKNTDLSEEMKEAKSVISSLSSFENDFKDIQSRLAIFDSYKENKGKINSDVKTAVSYKPDGIYFESINADLNKISISAISRSEIEIQQYMVNLKSSNKFENVNLGNVALDQFGSSFIFSISIDIKREI
jgi:Tfp pilus assembly protein PilN